MENKNIKDMREFQDLLSYVKASSGTSGLRQEIPRLRHDGNNIVASTIEYVCDFVDAVELSSREFTPKR